MQPLPNAEPQNPSCGACGAETEFDGDDFACRDCLIYFDPNEFEAKYLVEDTPPCGVMCDNSWHKTPGAIYPGVSFVCQPCALPEGHTSMHWTGCIAKRPERTGV